MKRIRHLVTGEVFEGPDNEPVPEGYEVVPTASGGYFERMAQPATRALAGALEPAVRVATDPVVSMLSGSERWFPSPPGSAAPAAESIAGMVVPQTPIQAGAMAGTLAVPALRPLAAAAPVLARVLAGPAARIAGGAIGGEVAGEFTGETPGMGAALGGGMAAGGEVLGAGLSKVRGSGAGAKAALNAAESQSILETLDRVAPALGRAVRAAADKVSPLLKSKPTAAALQEVALGRAGKDVLSQTMERGMLDTTLAAQGQKISSPALMTAWTMLPRTNVLAQRLKAQLAPDPNGEFTVSQAERLLSELGQAAFKGEAGSPIARGISGLEMRRLHEQAVQEAESALPGVAGSVFRTARGEYNAGQALLDALREPGAFQGFPNRIFANTRALQDYLSANRAELRQRLGSAQFDELWNALGRGGQLGTLDIPVPGPGTTGTALMQVYGRGQGGAPQIAGSLLRTALPNLGASLTGRPPYALPPMLQAILDAALQRAGGAALERSP